MPKAKGPSTIRKPVTISTLKQSMIDCKTAFGTVEELEWLRDEIASHRVEDDKRLPQSTWAKIRTDHKTRYLPDPRVEELEQKFFTAFSVCVREHGVEFWKEWLDDSKEHHRNWKPWRGALTSPNRGFRQAHDPANRGKQTAARADSHGQHPGKTHHQQYLPKHNNKQPGPSSSHIQVTSATREQQHKTTEAVAACYQHFGTLNRLAWVEAEVSLSLAVAKQKHPNMSVTEQLNRGLSNEAWSKIGSSYIRQFSHEHEYVEPLKEDFEHFFYLYKAQYYNGGCFWASWYSGQTLNITANNSKRHADNVTRSDASFHNGKRPKR